MLLLPTRRFAVNYLHDPIFLENKRPAYLIEIRQENGFFQLALPVGLRVSPKVLEILGNFGKNLFNRLQLFLDLGLELIELFDAVLVSLRVGLSERVVRKAQFGRKFNKGIIVELRKNLALELRQVPLWLAGVDLDLRRIDDGGCVFACSLHSKVRNN